jgi:hypothetical protein
LTALLSYASDILLGAGTIGVILWCVVLARRIASINTLDSGVGGAIAVLSQQVDDMTKALAAAQAAAATSGASIAEITARAEAVSKKLELMVAALHDLPEEDLAGRPAPSRRAEPPLNLAFARTDPPATAAPSDELRLPEFLSARRSRAL